MRYTYIKLVNYSRFPLMQSDTLELHFDSKLVMLVGPNGSGKSSLLSELSVLPADKSNFFKGGYKEVHVEKSGSCYCLISDFTGSSAKFSFLQDSVELNPSSTVTVQRDLAAIHFNMTPLVHDILTGGESFTDMSVLSRKKLFNSITHLNIDTIVENYEKLKDELKNNEYMIKTMSSRLISEKEKLLDEQKTVAVKERLQGLKTHIDTLLSIRTQMHHLKSAKELHEAASALSHAKAALDKLRSDNYVLLSAHPRGSLVATEESFKTRLTTVSIELKNCYKQLESLMYDKKSLELAKTSDISTIQESIDSSSNAMRMIESRLEVMPITTESVKQAIADLTVLERSLPEVLEGLVVNEDKRLSKANYTTLVEKKNYLLNALNEELKKESSVQAELKELQSHSSLNCPNCNHNWLPSEVSGRIAKANAYLNENLKTKAKLQHSIKELEPLIEEQQTYLGKMTVFTSLYNATKHNAKEFWKYVLDRSLLYNSPATILRVVTNAISDCSAIESYHEHKSKIAFLKEQQALLSVAKSTSYENNANSIAAVEYEIQELMQETEDTKHSLGLCSRASWVYEAIDKCQATFNKCKVQAHSSVTKHTVDSVVEQIEQELNLSKITVIELEKELGRNSSVLSTISVIEAHIQECQENKKVLTILTQELSPKSGLIAKTISNFLNVIIKSVNTVVASVWDYRMELKAINLEDDPLNYKFKVQVEDRLTVDDISKISSGMKEMVNLAMKMTTYKLLKLEGYPMKLDEFGVKLDSVHRAKIADVIFKMLGSPQFSQIFLITHLDLAYSDFKDTQLVELS